MHDVINGNAQVFTRTRDRQGFREEMQLKIRLKFFAEGSYRFSFLRDTWSEPSAICK